MHGYFSKGKEPKRLKTVRTSRVAAYVWAQYKLGKEGYSRETAEQAVGGKRLVRVGTRSETPALTRGAGLTDSLLPLQGHIVVPAALEISRDWNCPTFATSMIG